MRTREPGGSVGADELRKLLLDGGVDRWSPLSETLMMNAARGITWSGRSCPASRRRNLGGL
jgi:thymidylate kinase